MSPTQDVFLDPPLPLEQLRALSESLRAEIRGLLRLVSDGTLDLSSLSIEELQELGEAQREIRDRLACCGGYVHEFEGIAYDLRVSLAPYLPLGLVVPTSMLVH